MSCRPDCQWFTQAERLKELLQSARSLSDQRRVLLEETQAALQNALTRLAELAPPEAPRVLAP